MRKITILAAMLLLAPGISQAKTLEDLLVEKGVITKGEASAASSSSASKVYWNGGTRLDFPDTGFTVGINTLVQTRYQFTDSDEDVGGSNTSSFSVNKAQLAISGTALNEEFSYRLETDFTGAVDSNGTRVPFLLDGYLTWRACDSVDVKMGHFKTLLGRGFNAADGGQQFADSAFISNYFAAGRQNGAVASTKFADGQFLLSAGLFNGTSDGEGSNRPGVDTRHAGMVSVRWNPMGQMDMAEEGDVNWTEDMAVSVGATYAALSARNDISNDSVANAETTTDNRIAVDANLKYQGWSLHAELFNSAFEGDQEGDADETEPTGFYAQAGYFVDPKVLEVAARYGYLDCDDGTAGGICAGQDNVNEVTAGVNYYFWKHHLKAQLNYTLANQDAVGAGGDDVNTNFWIFQMTGSF